MTLSAVPGQQEAAIDAAHVKFTGMSLDALATPPEIDDRMTFTVSATCVGREIVRRKDGELRTIMKMEVTDVEPTSEPEKPERDPALPFDDNPDAEL